MLKRVFSLVMFILLLTSMLTFAFNIQPVRASGTIYIRADGSIDPPNAPISTVDNITYIFAGDINDESIVIERDNVVVDGAGYTLQGPGSGSGFDWSGINNVTIKHANIRNFDGGIWFDSSSNNTISGNNITANNGEPGGIRFNYSSLNSISGNNVVANNGFGITLFSSSSNSISGNDITDNTYGGIWLDSSSSNSVSGNNITENNGDGIYLDGSSGNSVSGNNIANNGDGIWLYYSTINSISGNNITANVYGISVFDFSDYNSISGNNITENNMGGMDLYSSSGNSVFHNNFINNTGQVYSNDSANIWDDSYPSGGNYWSDYAGVDLRKNPYQNETGSDGIGDTPYSIDSDNTDRYPLMNLWVSTRLLGDINGDGIVDIYDAILLANAYNSTPGNANWNPNADINGDNVVDIYDAIILANNFGKTA